MSRYGSMLRYRSQDSHVEIPMSRYRCRCAGQLSRYRYRGIDAELRIDVEIPMSSYKCRDTDVEVSMSMCRTAIEIPISRYLFEVRNPKTCNVDVPDSYRDTDIEVSMQSYGSILRYRCRVINVEIPMSRYRCRCAGQEDFGNVFGIGIFW